MTDKHMQIGEVATRTELSLRTIRYYEEVGLVSPSSRTSGGFRLYSEADVERLELVKRMKPLDFSLEDMGALLQVVDELDAGPSTAERTDLLARLEDFRTAADSRVADLRRKLTFAEEFAAGLDSRLEAQRSSAARS